MRVQQLSLFYEGAVSPSSDWCQRWRDGRHHWRHQGEGGFDSREYDVAPIAETEARRFVVQHHYLATYPASRFRYGLYARSGALVGVAVLSVPSRAAVLTGPFPRLVPYRESLELGRFILLDAVPANAESWFWARCRELAAREGLGGLVAFSDPVPRRTREGAVVFPGHVGTAYQASNGVYLGRSTARTLTLLPDGSVFSDRAASKVRRGERGHSYAERQLERCGARPRRPGEEGADWLREVLAAVGARKVRHPGNHRYVWAIGPRRRLVSLAGVALPYPKRVEVVG